MSKSLKKLIDINRLREFKNKLVGTGSAYVQTGAVDQTIAGTKTFSKPIAGSVTGSSGSCTGNAATATKLATARTINGTAFNGTANITTANWGTARNISIADATATNTGEAVSVNGSAAVTLKLPAAIKADVTGSLTGNAASANIATKATQDAAGNTITTTYATKAENNTKANNSEVVHKSGDETIAGTKTFSNGVLLTNANAFMAQNGGYTLVLRNDGGSTYLLMSDKDGAPGTWSSARPLVISNSTGVCSINGNASTATKLAAKRTIALSGAATGTATSFDGSGNITIPVTALSPSAIRAHILSMVYPVGSVYISVNDVSPEKFLGGKWIKISQGRVLQGASGTQTAGTEVSAGLPNISVSSNGAHTHTRGSMNITGTVATHNGCTTIGSEEGAFFAYDSHSTYQAADCYSGASSSHYIAFSADRTWTGSTSSDGAHSHAAYITGITGNSTTVQPPALLVNIWKRTA